MGAEESHGLRLELSLGARESYAFDRSHLVQLSKEPRARANERSRKTRGRLFVPEKGRFAVCSRGAMHAKDNLLIRS